MIMCLSVPQFRATQLGNGPQSHPHLGLKAVPKALVLHGRKLSGSRFQRVFGHNAQGIFNIFGSANWGTGAGGDPDSPKKPHMDVHWIVEDDFPVQRLLFLFCWVLSQVYQSKSSYIVRGWTSFPLVKSRET